MKWKQVRAKKALPVDNTAIEAFAKDADLIVQRWNDLNAERSKGRLVLRTEGENRDWPAKVVRLLADTGVGSCSMTLLFVRFDEEKGLVASIPSLPLPFAFESIDIEGFKEILEDFDPSE